MGLNGEKMLQSLKHLSQVDKMKQVEPMSYALFPGYHCPLMGAMLTIRAIKDSVMLVLGPDECAYYTKMATSGNGSMSADGCQIVSVVLEQHDVTFGCQEKLEEAMEELNDEYHPKAVFIVTTCVPEITVMMWSQWQIYLPISMASQLWSFTQRILRPMTICQVLSIRLKSVVR